MNTENGSPTDAIFNPLNDLIDEKESEILNEKTAFIDDDDIVDNIVLSELIADDIDSNKFQLLFIADEIYYIFHHAENGEVSLIGNYSVDEIPSELSADTTLFKLMLSDIDKIINKFSNSPTASDEVVNILTALIESVNKLIVDKDKSKAILKESADVVKDIIKEYSIKISAKVSSEIGNKILKKLADDREPSAKLLANYLNFNGAFYLEYTTRKRYMKVDKGFKEVTIKDVSEFFNDEFGYNEISEKKSKEVLGFITREISTDYNLIQFTNGTLNTDDEIFHENIFYDNVLPKRVVPFAYTENAESEFKATDLYAENKAILKTDRKEWVNNELIYYISVGASGFAINELDALITIVGKPNSRKSTLLELIKRIFDYSEVKLHIISENPRFQLLPCIAKDINVDDDMQNFRITNIGNLNTFVSGNGIEVEIKGENIGAKLTGETTPIIWGASNSLPSIIGDGFERRLILILAENTFTKSESKKSYMKDIKSGKRDDEIGLMFSYSLQLYFKYRDSPIIDETVSELMIDEWEWKASPSKKGAELMFIDEYTFTERLDELIAAKKVVGYSKESGGIIKVEKFVDNGDNPDSEKKTEIVIVKTDIDKDEVNRLFKKFHRLAFKKNRIFKEQLKPSTKAIKYAMNVNGYDETPKKIPICDEDGEVIRYSSKRVYKDCILVKNLIGFDNWEDML